MGGQAAKLRRIGTCGVDRGMMIILVVRDVVMDCDLLRQVGIDLVEQAAIMVDDNCRHFICLLPVKYRKARARSAEALPVSN